MSNGAMCCYLRACCPPGAQREALTNKLYQLLAEELHRQGAPAATATGAAEQENNACAAQAAWLLDHFDLVPRGVGEAIVKAYRPVFAEKAGA